ncbi:hypothetical protein H0H81_005080 [Sphagnurus paluster]|uniref:SUZ domain-containing protein n=1 Tax=Sphagnurus paluster TaxID=117069 RepID=A0A9P7FXY3_9AGAR|nr:hypothetical protein H0H81_005080 [Sphagnurus paluster]
MAPARRLCDLVPPEMTAQPAFKIMRRSAPERRSSKAQSQAGSVAGEDADLSDVEPSETGSLGGRSSATGGSSNKKRMTIEEREAAYIEARSRIFGLEEKEKGKEKDMSASSSSLSLVSGSASTSGEGGSSAAGDLDETVSSPATESEYSGPSGPVVREKKENNRHLPRNASASSSRSLRGAPGSSRNSRAPSPSFTFATIYEPSQPMYDPSQPPHHAYHPQYAYPYAPPGQPHNAYYGYPYYPPYNPYQSPPLPQHSASDPSTPSNEIYMSAPHGGYAHPYGGWPPPQHPAPPPPHMQHPSQIPPPPPHHGMNPNGAPPPGHAPQYQPYMPPPHAYPYPMSYYPPQPGQPPLESPPSHGNQNVYDTPRGVMANPANNNSAPNIGRNGAVSHANANGRAPNRHNGVNGGKARGAPPMNQGRGAWSYGPGVSQGGYASSPGSVGMDTIGPRLTSRKASNHSVASSANSRSSNCDDVSSTAVSKSSSTTSSSSRRTYTSTTSSQHPLPPRPDWAVGLKPQPTLHSTQSRHHADHSHNNNNSNNNNTPITAPRSLNGNGNGNGSSGHNVAFQHQHQHQQHQQKPVPLQSPTDFPPLSAVSAAAPEKRTPVVSGAWGSNATNRSIRMTSPGQPANANVNANVLVQHHSSNNGAGDGGMQTQLQDADRGFERPPPKSAELFNPKVLRRPAIASGGKAQVQPSEKEKKGAGEGGVGDVGGGAGALAGQVEAMHLGAVESPQLVQAPLEVLSSV